MSRIGNLVTEVPFFDALTFEKLLALQEVYPEVKTSILFKSSPQINAISKDVFERWKKAKNISLTIDGLEKEKAELEKYQAADFALFTVRETGNKDLFKNLNTILLCLLRRIILKSI
jgi:bla regulator protein BlaR1